MKHDLEIYREQLTIVFSGKKEITNTELINSLTEQRKCSQAETKKIIGYCTRNGLLSVRHLVSHTFIYTINKNLKTGTVSESGR